MQDFCFHNIWPWWRRHEGGHHQHKECKNPHSGNYLSCYGSWWWGEGCCYHQDYYWRHNYNRYSLDSSFWGAITRPFEWWRIQSVGFTSNGWNARPAAISIARFWWVSGWGHFSPCNGCIYCGDASTSSTSWLSSSSYTSLPLSLIPSPHTPSPQRCSSGVRPTTRSHSTGERAGFHGRKWIEDHYGVKTISMFLIYSANSPWGLTLAVSLHLDAREGIIFLA